MTFRLAVNPNTPRTPAVEACIQAEQRRETIFEAIAKLRCGDWEYFQIAFSGKPFDELTPEDQERVLELGGTPDEYHLWHASYAGWKSQQQQGVPLSDWVETLLPRRPAAA